MLVQDFRRNQHRWTFEQFKMFADEFPMSFLSMDSLVVNEENVEDFIRTIATFEKCDVVLKEAISNDGYEYTLKDITLMVELDIRVTEIESGALRTDGRISYVYR